MTLTFMRPAIALTLALSLASCGGKATFPISGTIAGLNYEGLVLSTNGMDLPVAPNATSFTFPNPLSYGEVYNVTPKSQPKHQTCSFATIIGNSPTIYNGPSDTAGRFGAINIGLACTMNTIALGGKITGLASAGLQLTNGTSGPITPLATDTTFTFPAVAYGSTYGITVLVQPADQTCSVVNGTGSMTDDAPTNIEVNCVNKT